MAAAYPSPNEKATLRPFSYDSRDIENQPSHHAPGSKSQPRPQTQPPETDSNYDPDPTWNKNLQVISKYLLILVLIVGITAAVDTLDILPARLTAVLLVVSLITYSFKRPAQILRKKKLERTTRHIMVGLTGVALLLFVALIVLLLIFRLVPSLKGKKIADKENVWKWLVIALVSCLFGVIWICGDFLRTYVQREYDDNEELVYFVSASRWTVNCICFFGGELIVLRVAPKYKNEANIYGMEIYKWIAVIDLIICGCHVIRIVTRLMIPFLDLYREDGTTGKSRSYNRYVIYMAKGLRGSINVVLFMVLILLTWCFYVDPKLKSRDEDEDNFMRAKGTFLALLVGSVLWVLKNFLLLLWEAREFYKRISDRMLKASMQLYFLIKIFGLELEEAELVNLSVCGNDDRAELVNDDDRAIKLPKLLHVPSVLGDCMRGGDNGGGGGDPTKKKQDRKKLTPQNAKDIIPHKIVGRRSKTETLPYDVLQRLSGYLVAADEIWTRKEDEEPTDSVSSKISKFRKEWKEQYPNGEDGEVTMDELKEKLNKMIENEGTSTDKDKNKLNDEDMELLYKQVEEVNRTRKEVWYGDLEKWLTRAYKNCQTLGRAIAGNRDGVVYLNKIMAVAIVIAVLIVWLFLVQLTTREIIAAIASPLIAVAFVFGDSAKTLFQGMVFAFGVHPFDVGDICIINGTQTLEVKKLGIWKTTFLKEGCKDKEVIYPNSALATATIVKHKSILDMIDYLEFYVSNKVTVEKLKELKKRIEEHLKKHEEKFESESSQVVLKDIGDKEVGDRVKIGVHFKHLMSFHSMTYLECLKMKNESTSELLQEIKSLADNCEKESAENEVSGKGGDRGGRHYYN